MKKNYLTPEMDVTVFTAEDMITTSGAPATAPVKTDFTGDWQTGGDPSLDTTVDAW